MKSGVEHIRRLQIFNRMMLLAVLVVAADQWLKSNTPAPYLNPGFSFSLAQTVDPRALLIILGLVAIGLFAATFRAAGRVWQTRVAHTVFFAAAFSNWLDRWKFGAVRDIWLLPGTSLRNNLADWLLTIALGLGVVYFLIHEGKNHDHA